MGTQNHLFCFSNSLRASKAHVALSNCIAWEILAQNDWNMLSQKIAVLWKEVCTFRCLEEPAEVLVEVLNDKVGKFVKRVERLLQKVLLEVITAGK